MSSVTAALAAAASSAMSKPGVLGVACVDAQGLCVHEAGTVPKACSGSIAELAQHAFALVGADAVVTCDAAQGKVVLSRSEGGVVIALFMEPRAQ